MRLPPGARVVRDGFDSSAGHFGIGAVRVDFDYGLSADPLATRSESEGAEKRATEVDGRPGFVMTYKMRTAGGGWRSFVGVHVPQVHEGRRERLTLLAYDEHDAITASSLEGMMDRLVSSIRFDQPP